MMLKKAGLVVAAAGAFTLPVVAQSGAPDTISALLSEVRQLRITMERSAAVTPQVQLLAARLTVQNERLSRAAAAHDAVQDELEQTTATIARMSARIQELEASGNGEANPAVQRQIAGEQRALKSEVESQTAQETRLRAKESELANALAAEQSRWAELNGRLDDLERTLNSRKF